MNQKKLRKTRNENLKKLVNKDRLKRNVVNIHPQNSKRHEKKKFELCWKLEQQEKEYVTEARFKDKDLRADIYVLDDDEIWEVETSKQELEDRKNKYPENKTYVWPLWNGSEQVITLDEL